MTTTFTRREPNDRARLVAALQTLVEHYSEPDLIGGPVVAGAKLTVASDVTGYAMAKLMERLVVEGYVKPERAAELRERAHNLEHGRGFLTDRELSSPKPEPETPNPKKRTKKLVDNDAKLIDELFS